MYAFLCLIMILYLFACVNAASHSCMFLGFQECKHYACTHGSIDVNAGAQNGVTALLIAAKFDCQEIVRSLLQDKRIDVNLTNKIRGATALWVATQRGNQEIVEMILNVSTCEVNKATKAGIRLFKNFLPDSINAEE